MNGAEDLASSNSGHCCRDYVVLFTMNMNNINIFLAEQREILLDPADKPKTGTKR